MIHKPGDVLTLRKKWSSLVVWSTPEDAVVHHSLGENTWTLLAKGTYLAIAVFKHGDESIVCLLTPHGIRYVRRENT